MRDFDRAAVEEYGIPSIVLMENAALRVVEFLEAKFAPLRDKKIVILCGKGNNGGDGLAIARHLKLQHPHARTMAFLLASSDSLNGDAKLSYEICRKAASIIRELSFPIPNETIHLLRTAHAHRPTIVIDAIYGTGFHGEFSGAATEILSFLPENTIKVAVDLPSGLNSDNGIFAGKYSPNGKHFPFGWQADYTVTFVGPKKGFFVREGLEACGELWVGHVGVDLTSLENPQWEADTLDLETAQRFIPKRQIDAHKGDAGRVLIIGGSLGMSGAVALASRAALNAGCGLCIAAIPEKVLPIFAASILEATSHPLPCDESGKLLESAADSLPELWKGVQVVALGPGIGRSDETQALVRRIVRECPVPLVIDADALHALPSVAEEVKNRAADTILTPHPGEMGVLMGISAGEVNDARFETVAACAQKYGAIVVLKGARTLVATPEGQIFVNLTGNAGMATGGSGDVLTGTIAGLLAQLKNSEDATKLGVYLHGFAGDLAFEERGNGLVAGDIAANLGRALVEIPKREVERINGRLRRLM